MSQHALHKLQSLWKDLVFGRVQKIVTKPEDVLLIHIYRTITTEDGRILHNHIDYRVTSNRVEDIPKEDLWRAHIAWKYYYGFTMEGVYFQQSDYNELDLDIDLTMRFSNLGNHTGGWELPESDTLICGIPIETAKGVRFKKWFTCKPNFERLHSVIMTDNSKGLTEEELAGHLITGAYPDMYWAVARLVLFDNVEAFVQQIGRQQPIHPYHGQKYKSPGYLKEGNQPTVDWNGMFLPRRADQYVHELSYRLDEPKWWEEFKRIAKERFPKWSSKDHPGCGGWCYACSAEGRWEDEEYWEIDNPYQFAETY